MKFDPLPSECLVDEVLRIRVRDALPGENVTLRLCNAWNATVFLSQARFTADASGTVDLARDAPVSGSYAGVDAMGLFWSRTAMRAQDAPALHVAADPLTVRLVAESADGQRSAACAIRRVYRGPGVTLRNLEDNGLRGKMFEPPGAGPHPAVLVVGGSGGGFEWSQEVAALLASHGFAALSLAYFGVEGLPPTLDRIPLEYFASGLEWMAEQATVANDRIGVVGASRGGELALLLGSTFAAIRCVVTYVPSGVLWASYPFSGHSAGTVGGRELPFASTPNHASDPRAVIAVERIGGPVLMISGADDGLWNSAELADVALRRLQDTKFPHRFEHLCYMRAGHDVAWPNRPTTMTRFVHPVSGEALDAGGTPEGTAHARSDSWPRMLEFLRSALGPTKS